MIYMLLFYIHLAGSSEFINPVFEVCHPHSAFKLYGEVNSVKKHNYKMWLNDGVY